MRRIAIIAWHAGVLAGAALMLYPLLWMVVSSLRPEYQIPGNLSLWLAQAPLWENFASGWNALARPFGVYVLNSTIVSIGAVVGNLIACSMAGYAFARLSFRGRRLGLGIVIATLLLPGYVTFVAQYVMFSKLGLVNTFVPLILPKFLAVDSFFVFMITQFIRGIPRELDDAARLDGCGYIRTFFSIIVPLIRAPLATTAVFTFLWTWGDFFSQLVYLTKEDVKTAAVAIAAFADPDASTEYGPMFAMALLTLAPIFIVFTLFQKQLVRGIASTGFK
ncbi:carbohydrate ABC transporter permease [Jiangella anatolica]|uniref:carbohydrate ABC transporter permease n=1 Tax=Jiangella anatolica TaxID=2670374 RepID=UPI001314E213|nr:carbohydrate ABC transporter permease [Jiangella anatolica]